MSDGSNPDLAAFNSQFARTMQNAARERVNRDHTWWINGNPMNLYQDGDKKIIHPVHLATANCSYCDNAQHVGVYGTPALALDAARRIRSNAMPCPSCMKDLCTAAYTEQFQRSWAYRGREMPRFMVGKNAIRNLLADGSMHYMYHRPGCPHYRRHGAVDFGHRDGFDGFYRSMNEVDPKRFTTISLQPCHHCFPEAVADIARRLNAKDFKSRHLLKEDIWNGRFVLHHYDCMVAQDKFIDMGWFFNLNEAGRALLRLVTLPVQIAMLRPGNPERPLSLDRCSRCMTVEEFNKLHTAYCAAFLSACEEQNIK